MRKINPLLIISVFACYTTSAQVTSRATTIEINKVGTVNMADITEDYRPAVQSLEPAPGSETEEGYMNMLRQQVGEQYKNKKFNPADITRGNAPDATLLNNFQSGVFSSDPNDNTVAISNGGKLISIINTVIDIYDVPKDTLLKSISITSFDKSGKTGSMFDPKAFYDPIADRFIIVYLDNSSSTSSNIILAFSNSNDPMGTWNFYSIPGNPLNNGTWSDYPAVASTKKEFFITVNLVQDGATWQAGFKGSLIYQVDKKGGYAGNPTLTSVRHDNITFNAKLVRNLCPVKGGSTEYGPNMYFLSNKNLAVKNDSLFLVEVPDTIGAANQQLNVHLMLTPTPYKLSPNGRQSNNLPLTTNDSRVLGAFYENGIIQFVQNALDTVTGHCAVLHGTVQNITGTPTATFNIIADAVLDFGYPNISYAGNSASDNSSIISFNHTAPTVFAGISAVYYDGSNYSKILTLKNGAGYISDYFGLVNPERWGDYSGSQRKYNEPGKVWVTGYYGQSNDYSGTWAAEIGAPSISTGITTINNNTSASSLFPNPAPEMFSFSFTLVQEQDMVFNIYDMKGSLVKQLLSAPCTTGENVFSFSTTPLAAGVYVFQAQGNKGAQFSRKVVKE